MIGIYVYHIWLCFKIIKRRGDIEENSGPKCNSNQSFFICHPNPNSITAHNCFKISLLRAYISLYNFDVICKSEAYLESATSLDYKNVAFARYNLLRVDHAYDSKTGRVCVYYKSSPALKLTDIPYIQDCSIFEFLIGVKLCNFISLYRSPSQSSDSFEKLEDNLQLFLDIINNENPFLSFTG